MLWDLADINERASRYVARRGMAIEQRLGYGRDGSVFTTDLATAIKVHAQPGSYRRELECYFRLREQGVAEVLGHRVPQLLGNDDELHVIEMTIVQPPFLLDFVEVRLDEAPDFTAEVMEEWHERKREEFGDRWPDVQAVLHRLQERYGIHLMDIHSGNIKFGEDEG